MNQSARAQVAKQWAGLDARGRSRVIERVREGIPEIVRRHHLDAGKREPAHPAEVRAIFEWQAAPLTLARNDCSRVHKVIEALRSGHVLSDVATKLLDPAVLAPIYFALSEWHTFVVQHDFARAMAGANISGDVEFVLPYSSCIFEFQISGRAVVAFACMGGGAFDLHGFLFIQGDNGSWWATPGTPALVDFIKAHIRGICVSLDAEIMAREIVRAPEKLNAARARDDRPPLRDFHILRLDGRHAHREPAMGGTHRSPRLHFVRGHWRHLTTHRVWVHWHLKGDPALGFFDKDYSL